MIISIALFPSTSLQSHFFNTPVNCDIANGPHNLSSFVYQMTTKVHVIINP